MNILDTPILRLRFWREDSTGQIGKKAQEHIDDELLAKSDVLFVVFKHSLGESGEDGESGTVHEIKEAVKQGKEGAIFFSKEGADPTDMSVPANLSRLQEFRKWCEQNSLFYEFADKRDLQQRATEQLRRLAGKALGKHGAVTGPMEQLAQRATATQEAPSGERLYYFDAARRTQALDLFPIQNNVASPGEVSSSSDYAHTHAAGILDGRRRGDVWLLGHSAGHIEVRWNPAVNGRYLVLINRATAPGHDSWCESVVSVNDNRIDTLRHDFPGDSVLVVDFQQNVRLESFRADITGSSHPGLAGLEVHPAMHTPPDAVPK